MIRVVLACILCGSSALGRADPIEQTFDFDCDVPAGKVSDWVGSLVPRLQKVTGTVELLEPREHERWRPVASVFLFQGTDKVGLQLFRNRQQPDKLQVAALRPKSEGGRAALTSVPWNGARIEFELSVKESGDVELAVAGTVTTLRVKDVNARKLSLSCSTAQFKFKDVVVTSEPAQ